jgi:asparagine synthase (glutamine-hydrolysing)
VICAPRSSRTRAAISRTASDAELVLRAYRVWTDGCVEHLLGDFAFAIWDGDRRRLFCGRDPFGVKLLYFAGGGRTFLAGNTLACLRSAPRVTDRLDDRAVASFLLWGEHDDRGATILADVRSLPAGHRLSWSPGDAQPSVRRWFTLPDAAPSLAYDDRRDTIDHFRTLLDEAVEDRLRCRSAAVFMSGGIDSPMVAAAAATRLGARDGRVTAHTIVFDPLLPDRERHLSSLAARHLQIPIAHTQGDGVYTDWGWMRTTRAPEPPMGPATLPALEAYRRVSAEHRVALTGYDGDSLLAHALGPLWRARLRGGDLPTLAREVAWHVRRRRLPRIGVRAAWARRGARRDVDVGYPEWVRPAFATGSPCGSDGGARGKARVPREPEGPLAERSSARPGETSSTRWIRG